jgi:polysaccharide pyruvyl transferase WcaK-like protein
VSQRLCSRTLSPGKIGEALARTVGTARRKGREASPKIGLFGGFGSGNIGNDASLEAMLGFLRSSRPELVLDVMCGGPETVAERYDVAAVSTYWHVNFKCGRALLPAMTVAGRALGKVIDIFRIAAWVRRHDVVIVPGMGILETSLPLRAWQFPLTMFVLCVSGRFLGTRVALVSIGVDVIDQRLNRWLLMTAARCAAYRSYRDEMSQLIVRRQGLDGVTDHVYRDLVFGIAVPPCATADSRTVGIGVMDYHGGSDDPRARAEKIRSAYVEKLKSFARWLLDHGHKIRLYVGDSNGSDDAVVNELLTDLRAYRPDLDRNWVMTEPTLTFAELTRAMIPAGTVVATRYHNVICALKLSIPTISIGYSAKNSALMADMGMEEYCQSISSLDVPLLIEQFTTLQCRAPQVRQQIAERTAGSELLVERQFAELSAWLDESTSAWLGESTVANASVFSE